jgi:hypothetical protein
LVVAPFDPSDPANANRLAAFRAQYGVANSVQIVGGWQGQLSNSAERLTLYRPGPPPANDPTVIPRLLEDEVVYDDVSPWPSHADGLGSTLTRVNLSGWGNDPQSWAAATATPGSAGAFVPLPGDSNADGQFDQLDIVQVLQAGKYRTGQPATFAEGDWNLDGLFNQLDIVLALQLDHYLEGPYAAFSRSTRASMAGDRAEAQQVDHLLADEADDDDLLVS